MAAAENKYSVLIISEYRQFTDSLRALLSAGGSYKVEYTDSAEEISVRLGESSERISDIVLIRMPLKAADGMLLAGKLSARAGCVVTLFVMPEDYAETFEKASAVGIYTLPLTASRGLVEQSLDWMRSSCARFGGIAKNTGKMERKMAEIRTVNRAKWLLIANADMTESDAHKHIERQAMNKGVSKAAIAEEIIRKYG